MSVSISGRTRLAGIIGWPVAHSLSPAMHNAAYEATGLDWAYVPLPVRDENDLERVLGAIRVLPFVGFNVTMPYKRVMIDHCDEVAMLARIAGAVNTVHCVDGRLIGYNTDGRGLVDSLAADVGFSPEGRSVVITGAGGASGAALVAFVLAKAARVTVLNRTLERAEELVERVRPHARETELLAAALDASAREMVYDAALVVNATSVGMSAGDPSPVPQEWLNSGQVITDMIYRAEPTAFVRAARDAGATVVDGLGMLVSQGAMSLEIWNEGAQVTAPRDLMAEAATAAIAEAASRGVEGTE